MSADYHSTKRLREIAALHGGGVSGGTHTRFCGNCSKSIFSNGAPSSDNNEDEEILCSECLGNGHNDKREATHIRFGSCTWCEKPCDLLTLTEWKDDSLCGVCTDIAIHNNKVTNSRYELEGLPQWLDMEEGDYRQPGDILYKLPNFDNIMEEEDDMISEGAADDNNNMDIDIDEVGNGLNGGLIGGDDTESNDGDGSLSSGDFSGGDGDVQDEEEVIPQGTLSSVLDAVGASRVLSFLDDRSLLKLADALDDTQGSLANSISEEFTNRGVDPANVKPLNVDMEEETVVDNMEMDDEDAKYYDTDSVVRSAIYLLYEELVPLHLMRQWTDNTEIVLKFVGRILSDTQGAISLDECEGSNHRKERFLSQLLLLKSCGILSVDQRNDGDVLIAAGPRLLEIDYEDEVDEMVDDTTHSSDDEDVDLDDDEGASLVGNGSPRAQQLFGYEDQGQLQRQPFTLDSLKKFEFNLPSQQKKACFGSHDVIFPASGIVLPGIRSAEQQQRAEEQLAEEQLAHHPSHEETQETATTENTARDFCSICICNDNFIQCDDCDEFYCYGCAPVEEDDPAVVHERVPWSCWYCIFKEKGIAIADAGNRLKKSCGWPRHLSTVDDLDDSMDDTIEKVREYLVRDGIVFKDCVKMNRIIARLLATYGGAITPVLKRIRSLVKAINEDVSQDDDDDTSAGESVDHRS